MCPYISLPETELGGFAVDEAPAYPTKSHCLSCERALLPTVLPALGPRHLFSLRVEVGPGARVWGA